MAADNSIIIFHRSKHNSKEDVTNQQAFLQANHHIIGSAKIIDYATSGNIEAKKVYEAFGKDNSSTKITVIVNSFLSKKEFDVQYDLYLFLRSLKLMGFVSDMYLTDYEGYLYKATDAMKIL